MDVIRVGVVRVSIHSSECMCSSRLDGLCECESSIRCQKGVNFMGCSVPMFCDVDQSGIDVQCRGCIYFMTKFDIEQQFCGRLDHRDVFVEYVRMKVC